MRKLFLFFVALGSCFILSAQQTPQADSLKEYTGIYKFPEGSDVTEIKIGIENDTLWAYSVKGNSELKKIEKDVFEVVQYTGTATFKRDENGKIIVLHIAVGKLIMDGKKSDETSTGLPDQRQRSPKK